MSVQNYLIDCEINYVLYEMKKRIDEKYCRTQTTKLCTLNATINIKKEKYEILPNFLIMEDEEGQQFITHEYCLPRDSKNKYIKRSKMYDDRLEQVNQQIRNKDKASGVFTAGEQVNKYSYINVSTSSYTIIKVNERLYGVTCLHVLDSIKNLNKLRCFIDHRRMSTNTSLVSCMSLPEVTVPVEYLEARQQILSKFRHKEKKNLHDRECNKHPRPSMDILLFLLPSYLEDEYLEKNYYYEIETDPKWEDYDKFVYFISHQGNPGNFNFKDEYKYTFPSYINIPIRNLVFTSCKTVTFGKILDNNPKGLGTGCFTSFFGASGAGVINSKGNLVYITGLSYYDDQSEKEGKNTTNLIVEITEDILKLHLFDIRCSGENKQSGSFNFNIITSLRQDLFNLIFEEFIDKLEIKEGLKLSYELYFYFDGKRSSIKETFKHCNYEIMSRIRKISGKKCKTNKIILVYVVIKLKDKKSYEIASSLILKGRSYILF